MVQLVAITRPVLARRGSSYRDAEALTPTDRESWTPKLAALLGVLPYDVRQRTSGALPWIVARVADGIEAELLVTRLRDAGFGAVALDPSGIRFEPSDALAQRVYLRDRSLYVEPWGREIALDGVLFATLSTIDQRHNRHAIEKKEHHYRGARTWTEIVVSRDMSLQRARALHLFLRDEAPVRLLEGSFALPEESGPTSRVRFDALLEKLRPRLPASARFFDDFVKNPRKRTPIRIFGDEVSNSSIEGNSAETDVAVALLVRAALEGQL